MAVYTHITHDEIAQHLALYDVGVLQAAEGIAEGVENTNYRVTTDQGKFILTLFEQRIDPADIPFCLAFMAHVSSKGIPCPKVMATRSGETLLRLAGKPSAILSFLEGASVKNPGIGEAAMMGAALARLHGAGADFALQRQNPIGWGQWERLVTACTERADSIQAGLSGLLHDELAYQKMPPADLPMGAVHADVFPDNVFFKDGALSGVIDFYFSCTEVFVYDLMMAVNAWCFPDPAKMRALLDSYESVRPLGVAERAALSFFGRRAALRIIATRLYDWLHRAPDAHVMPHDPLAHVRILKSYRDGSFAP